MLRVLLADDHEVVRDGLKRLLEREYGDPHVEEAATGEQALKLVGERPWDLVVLDIGLPGRSGLDVLVEMKRLRPEARILIFSMYPEEQVGLRALRAGASGYLTKGSRREETVRAIRKVVDSGRYMSPALAERMVLEFQGETQRLPHESLSGREFEVMRMIAEGKTLTQIADELSISVKTVGTYHTRILDKLGLDTNAALIRYALNHGLVS